MLCPFVRIIYFSLELDVLQGILHSLQPNHFNLLCVNIPHIRHDTFLTAHNIDAFACDIPSFDEHKPIEYTLASDDKLKTASVIKGFTSEVQNPF